MESFAVCVQTGVLVTRLETGDLTQHQSHCHFYQFPSAAAPLVSPLQDYKVTPAPEKQFDTVSRRFDFQSSESEDHLSLLSKTLKLFLLFLNNAIVAVRCIFLNYAVGKF